jgi:hypothetical protein
MLLYNHPRMPKYRYVMYVYQQNLGERASNLLRLIGKSEVWESNPQPLYNFYALLRPLCVLSRPVVQNTGSKGDANFCRHVHGACVLQSGREL